MRDEDDLGLSYEAALHGVQTAVAYELAGGGSGSAVLIP